MDFGPGTGDLRDVAVGPSREVAARVFGGRFDSALVTTYDAFDADVDLATVDSIGVAAGPGLDTLLDRVRAEAPALWPARVLVGLPTDRTGRKALEAALARHPDVALADVVESDRGLVLGLDHAENVAPEDRQRVLATLRTAPATAAPDVVPAATEDHPRRTGLTGRPLLARAGAVAFALTMVFLAVLVGVGQSSLGADGVLVTLLAGVLVAEIAIAVGVLYALRLARQGRAEQQEQRQLLLARTDRLIHLARTAAAKDKEKLREVEQLRREVDALGRLQSRARVEARERS